MSNFSSRGRGAAKERAPKQWKAPKVTPPKPVEVGQEPFSKTDRVCICGHSRKDHYYAIFDVCRIAECAGCVQFTEKSSWQSHAEEAEAKVELLERLLNKAEGRIGLLRVDKAELEQQLRDAKKALEVFMDTMAFAPSSVPGAIEEGLNRAYKMGQTINQHGKAAQQEEGQ